jgi:hypothetical protein
MSKKEKMDHFIRLGMSPTMRDDVERWRAKQGLATGKVPSFSDAIRQMIQKTLDAEKS